MKVIPIILISFALLLSTAGCAAPPEALRGLLPSPADRYVAEGDRLAANGRVAEAILTYRQAVMQDARHTAALRKLALAYTGQRRGRLARQYLEKAIALRPGDAALAADLAALPPSDSTNARAQAGLAFIACSRLADRDMVG